MKQNNYFSGEKNIFYSNEYDIVSDKKYCDLQWFLLTNKKNRNLINKNYEHYIWIDKLHMNESFFFEYSKYHSDNDDKNKNDKNQYIIKSKNRGKEFSFSEQNSINK